MLNKKSCIIKAKAKRDYVFKALVDNGNTVLIPYKDYNLVMRCMREAWFRLNLPAREIWYNPEIKKLNMDEIAVYDPLITPDFLTWLCDLHPTTKVTVQYSNRVNRSGIKPTDVIRSNLEYTSYDGDDCREYGMRQNPPGYAAQYSFYADEKYPAEYDVIYLGRDKGRAEILLDLQKKFEELGLKTYFHICADRSFLRFKKSFYKKEIPYEDYIELLKRTRAHLNLMPEGQTSVTQRDLESVFDEVKCITNNRGIKQFELYDPTRFFVLGEDDFNRLPEFIQVPFKPVPENVLAKYGTRRKRSE